MSIPLTEHAPTGRIDSAQELDLRRVRSQCERIRAGLGGLVDWIPVRPLSGSGVARWTGLKGPLCRRVLAAVQHRGEPAELARILPGIEGLTLFLEALESKQAPGGLTEPARQAIAAFAELIHEGGGSQRKLVAAIQDRLESAGNDATRESDRAATRRRLFGAASALTGTSCDALVAVSIVFRSPTKENELDAAGALGRLGYRARPGAPPLISKRYSHPEGASGDPVEAPGWALQRLLGTPGLKLTETQLDDQRVLTTCEGPKGDAPIDLWNGPVLDHGLVRFEPDEGSGYSTHCAVGTPSRALVHDLWVETPLARASVLRAGVYRATPDVFASMDYEQWYDRLPGDPQILLPSSNPTSGIEGVSPRHAEVLEQCFELARQDRREFVCYRCVVDSPIWMAVYRLTLEFDSGYQPESPG